MTPDPTHRLATMIYDLAWTIVGDGGISEKRCAEFAEEAIRTLGLVAPPPELVAELRAAERANEYPHYADIDRRAQVMADNRARLDAARNELLAAILTQLEKR